MAAPAFSVLVTAYNAGPFLQQAVRSVLAQTYSDFELILVDDGSTDGCLDFLSGLTDPRIRTLRQSNQGQPAAINTGLGIATGDWIALLDADDLWMPRKLEMHIACSSAYPSTDLTFDWSRLIDEEGKDHGVPAPPWQGSISFEDLLQNFVIATSSAIVFRRDAINRIGGMNVERPGVNDLEACLRIAALRPNNCRAVPAYLTCYRRHARQISLDWRKVQREWQHLLRRISEYAPRPVSGIIPLADSNLRCHLAALACQGGENFHGVLLALSSFARVPHHALFNRRNWWILATACGHLVLPRKLYRRAASAGRDRGIL